MTKKETCEIMHGWPAMTACDLKKANALFPHYLFYDARGDVTASCCGKHKRVKSQALGPHREKGVCPFCGAPATWYAKRYGKKILTEYVPVMFLHKRKKTVYAQTFWMRKEYTDKLTPSIEFRLTYSYRLRPGQAEMWEHNNYPSEDDYYIADWFKHPYNPLTDEMGIAAYHVIGWERLRGTHLAYLGGGVCTWTDDKYIGLAKRFMLASYYPIEMLEKLGLDCFVWDLLHGVMNKEIIDYSQKDIRKALGMNGAELKALRTYNEKIKILRLRKRLLKRGYAVGVDDLADLLLLCKNDYLQLLRLVDETGAGPLKLRRYLTGQLVECHCATSGFYTRASAFEHYVDYLRFCKDLGENVRDHMVAFPKDLRRAHDDRAVQAAVLANEIKSAEIHKTMEERKAKWKQRIDKYSFVYGGFVIIVPLTAAEIIAEGNALRHCVGGYADRHIQGVATILFLRREAAPEKPLVTIEMNGNQLVQVHGYRNEMEPCSDNPDRIPARKLYQKVLDVWLNWLKRGSLRDEDGKPKLPKKRGERKTA